MRCDSDCGECCGVTAVPTGEAQRVIEYAKANNIEPRRQGVACPWLHDNRCAVYPARPTVCRLFGHSELLVCTRGYNVNVALTIERRIMDAGTREARRQGVSLLHEVVYDSSEMEAMVLEEMGQKTGLAFVERPRHRTYHAAMALKMVGLGFANTLFLDNTTGEVR